MNQPPTTAGTFAPDWQVLELLSRCTRLASGIVRPIPHEGELSEDMALELLR